MLIQQQKSNGEDRQQQRLGGNEVAERRFAPSLHGTRFGTRRDREELSRLVHFLPFFFPHLLWIRKKNADKWADTTWRSFFFNGLQNRRVLKRRMDDKRIKLHFLECLETL